MKDSQNHEFREPEGVSFSSPAHARRQSAYAGEKSLAAAQNKSQKQQVTEAQDGLQAPETNGMAYSPAQAPTPLPADMDIPPSPMSLSPPEPTDEDIAADIRAYLNEEMDDGIQHATWCWEHADIRPPITPESLAELDMPRIINNPKLRHDVNFDRELHFRPNLDGSKGRQKILQADQYWRALEAELVMCQLVQIRRAQSPENEVYWSRIMKGSLQRLPSIFGAIRDILKTLVPDYDQKAVSERLDVDHIMQQIENGVCDLIDLGNWLAKVLKNHCAPMRDGLVDTMQKDIKRGAIEGKHEKLVSGLRQLMTILEAMKLDVANHQIRHMRPLLIDDTINFQRRYNAHRISIGKINPNDARHWLQRSLREQGSRLDALVSGLIRDMLQNDSANMCPQTFYLDSDRIRALRVELHSRVYHAICHDVLRELACPRGISEANLSRARDMLQSSVTAIVGAQGRFVDRLDNIAVEIVRVLLVVEGQYPLFDIDLLNYAEQRLSGCLRTDSDSFRRHSHELIRNLVPKVQSRVSTHTSMTALDLQDTLVPAPITSNRNSMGFGAVCEPAPHAPAAPIDADEDIIRRFTHIIALHWQVWRDLVYQDEDPASPASDREDDSNSDHGSESTMVQSAAPSPTMPVARAVYAPGKKWLPVSVTVTDVPSGLQTPAASPDASGEQSQPPSDTEMAPSDEAPDASQQQRQQA
ncbi:Putative T-complex 11 protein [Septoria linicola]|uniref:T-complex 11 protein n=1 Tax=Septoria linicola TaxID=215465 RepID=A0A9Q9ERN3_9PEZI|nr:Putative T-complex 11 protein [Septoria linicola]